MMHRRAFFASTSALTAIGLAGGTALAADHSKLSVVATFSILGDMVARIGGEHISLTTLVGPNGDAHVYQPVPADARAVSEADLLIVNGLAFEGWLDRLVEASGFEGARLVATDGIDPIPFEEDGDHHDDEDHDDDHAEHKHDDDHAEHKHDDDHARSSMHTTTIMPSTSTMMTTPSTKHAHDDHAEHKHR